MASPVFTRYCQSNKTLHNFSVDDDGDFSDAQMKPAPLRLTRKSPPIINQATQEPPSVAQQDGPAPGIDLFYETPTLAALSRDPLDPLARSHGMERSLPAPPAAPDLTSLVSKYEIIDAMSSADPQAIRSSPGPSRLDEPFTPTPSRRQSMQQSPGPSQQWFPKGPPFAEHTARHMRHSNMSSSEAEKSRPVSPGTRTSPSGSKMRTPLGFLKRDSPLRGHVEIELDDRRLGVRSYMEDQASPVQQRPASHRAHGYGGSLDAGISKRPSGIKAEERKGWDPRIVAERRKVFEGGRIPGSFTAPVVTRANVPSTLPMPPGFDSLRKFQPSRTDESDSQERRMAALTGLRASGSRHEIHKNQYASHRSTMQTPKYSRVKLLQEDTPQTKKKSVADLRKSFERASQSSADGTSAGATIPFSKTYPQYNSLAAGSMPATPRAVGPERNSGMPARIGHSAPISHTQSCSKAGVRGRMPQDPAFVAPRLKYTTSSENSTSTTIHRSARPSRDSGRLLVPSSSEIRGSRGALFKQSEEPNLVSRTRKRLSVPVSAASPPLLVSRSLSVKISTVPPTPGVTTTEGTGAGSHNGLPSKKVTDLRKVFDHPHAQAPFIPFMNKHRETASTKSGPSLPIMVSTTVAVTTNRGSSGSRSSAYSASISSEEGNTKRRGSHRHRSEFQDGPGERAARHPRTKLKKKRRESPVKDRISLFENLSHSASSIAGPSGAGRPMSYDESGVSKKASLPVESASKATEHTSTIGSRFLRAFSLSGRRKTVLDKGKLAKSSVGNVRKKSKTSLFSIATSGSKSQASTLFVKGTMRKVHRKADKVAAERSRESSADQSVSSAEVFETSPADALLATPYSHHASVTKSGRLVPARKSYGALQQKPNWRVQDVDDVNFTNPWEGNSKLKEVPRTSAAAVSSIDRSRTPIHPLPPRKPVAALPTTGTSETVATGRKSRYPSSSGKTTGKDILSGINKRSGVPCPPVLSPEAVLARPAKATRRIPSLSWGQRAAGAAAAAFGIGQRLNTLRDGGRGGTGDDRRRSKPSDGGSAGGRGVLDAAESFPGGMCGGKTGVGRFTPASGRAASADSGRVTPCSFHDE